MPTFTSAVTGATTQSFLTSAGVAPVTGTAVTGVTAPTTSVTGLNPGATSNLMVPAFDPNANPSNTRFAFANNSLTTTGSGAVNLVNPNTPTPTITLTNAQVVSGTVAPRQTVVTGVTAPTANNFLTLTSGTTTPTFANAITGLTSTPNAVVNNINVSTAQVLTNASATTTSVDKSVTGGNSGASAPVSSSLGCGTNANASGNLATALGENSIGTGAGATALGANAVASADGAIAIGASQSTGVNSIAIGTGAVATGSVAVGAAATAANGGAAFGDGATATGLNTTAIGTGASATFANSSAIGNGAVATRDNQVVIGTASNTYTAPGITSAASRAAQSGPLQVVTTDANGNLASDGGALFNNINILNSQMARITQNLDQLNHDVKRLNGGVAMAMSLGGVYLPEHQRFAIHTDVGFYNGAQAIAVQGIARINQTFTANGGVAYDMTGYGGVGGRVGISAGW